MPTVLSVAVEPGVVVLLVIPVVPLLLVVPVVLGPLSAAGVPAPLAGPGVSVPEVALPEVVALDVSDDPVSVALGPVEGVVVVVALDVLDEPVSALGLVDGAVPVVPVTVESVLLRPGIPLVF